MRICFVCNEYPPAQCGGIGTFTQVLGRSLVQDGHEVSVVGVYPPDIDLPEFDTDMGVKTWRLRRPKLPLRGFAARRMIYNKVRGLAERGEIDIVEVPDYEGWAAGWPKLPVPVVVRLHGSACYFASEIGSAIPRVQYWIERQSMKRACHRVSTSEYTARKTAELYSFDDMADIKVVYNAVEVPSTIPEASRDPLRVVYSGTLVKKKGVIPLMRAWNQVHLVNPAAQLHMYGKDGKNENGGSMRAELVRILTPESAETVHFHGHVLRSRVQKALRKARMAVFPSYSEAFALAPLEAMAQGCPTIYSTCASGPELVNSGVDGFLIDPDDVSGLAQTILRLLNDDMLAERIGDAGWDKVYRSFRLESMVKPNVSFYSSCLNGHSQRPA